MEGRTFHRSIPALRESLELLVKPLRLLENWPERRCSSSIVGVIATRIGAHRHRHAHVVVHGGDQRAPLSDVKVDHPD